MTRLTLICHAATAAVRAARFPDDEALDDLAMIRDSVGPRVVASRWLSAPERRATSTAALMAGAQDVVVERELRDWDCGRWRGRGLAALQNSEPEHVAAWLTDPAAAPHGGESLLELLARIGRWMDAQALQGTKTAAVAHPAILRAAVVKALDAGPATFWRVDAEPLGRAAFSHDGRRWTLRSLFGPRTPA